MDSTHLKDSTSSSTLSSASTKLGESAIPSSGGKAAAEFKAPETVPDKHDRRTIVLCFDGTGDSFDDDITNVIQFFSMLKKDDPEKQVVYYQASYFYNTGIGVSVTPRYFTTIANNITMAHDRALAGSLDDHVKDGYAFLVQNYKIGDKICLFGFSRGAYTARALAGMVYKVGLLPQNNGHQIPFAYNLYKDLKAWKKANDFKRAFSIDVKIHFVGVWDTVCSVGFLPQKLPYASSNDSILHFRHAVALDEHRAKFQPDPWNEPKKGEQVLGTANYTSLRPVQEDKTSDSHTDVKEVWFAGCHCDVGGGSVKNEVPHALARNALRWMIRECFKTETGIMFYVDPLKKLGFEVLSQGIVSPGLPSFSPGASIIRTRKNDNPPQSKPNYANEGGPLTAPESAIIKTEEEHEVQDALSPVYDQLEKWSWWLLEGLPLKRYLVQEQPDGSTKLSSSSWPNFMASRELPSKGKILVHRSVQTRLAAENIGVYKVNHHLTRAINEGRVEWVE